MSDRPTPLPDSLPEVVSQRRRRDNGRTGGESETGARTLVLLVALLALSAAVGASAARDEESRFKLFLVPCLPLGEDDAGGEAEWESDTEILKVELWGATELAGETLDVFIRLTREGVREFLLAGSVEIDNDGSTAARAALRLEMPEALEVESIVLPPGDRFQSVLLASDSDDCDRP
ncbi:MAG: hypothetical protein ACRDNY_12780 [Gaiellaceae bacterium]